MFWKVSFQPKISSKKTWWCIVWYVSAKTGGRAGNIYAPAVFVFVVLTIEDYLKFRRRMPNMFRSENENLSRSYQYKVLSELLAGGMEYDSETNEVHFQPSKLITPTIIALPENLREFDALKQRVQQCYLKSEKSIERSTGPDMFECGNRRIYRIRLSNVGGWTSSHLGRVSDVVFFSTFRVIDPCF